MRDKSSLIFILYLNTVERPRPARKGETKKFKDNEFFAYSAYPTCKITKPALNGLPAPNCPCCNRSYEKGVFCSNEGYLKLWRTVGGKILSDSQLVSLLTKGKTAKIKDFKSKAGKEFEAVLKLNKAEKKIEFELDKKK